MLGRVVASLSVSALRLALPLQSVGTRALSTLPPQTFQLNTIADNRGALKPVRDWLALCATRHALLPAVVAVESASVCTSSH
jgi:hypothetical protein